MRELAMIETPAKRILGELFPLRKGGGGHGARLMELARETPEEEIARDRRTLAKIAIGGGVLAGAGLGIIRKGRLPSPAAVSVKAPLKAVKRVAPVQVNRANPKVVRRKAKALVKEGVITPGEAQNLEEKRDKLSQVRDAAIIGGTVATGAGAVVAGRAVSKTAKDAQRTLSKVDALARRSAARVKNEVTAKAVAEEGGKLLKKKAKDTAKRFFPTFVKAGKVLTRHFETPAQRLLEGHEFAEALKTKDRSRYASRLKVATGVQKAYREGSNIPVDLPIADGQVIKSAYRKAGQISKWGTRGGKLAKDAADVVTGKPRARDASGRKKKREWEKSWAQETGKKALIPGAVLGYATGMKRSPKFRNANLRLVKKAKDTVNNYVPNTFETPAQRILEFSIFNFQASKKKEDRSLALKAAAGGAAAGAANGAVIGTLSSANSKAADDYFAVRRKRSVAGAPEGGKAFREGMFTKGEYWDRASHNATGKLRKTMRRRAAGGGLAGAALLGGVGYVATKRSQKPDTGGRKKFSTPAQRMGVIEMEVVEIEDNQFDAIAKEAGWDVRDPRGKSARVFAPGSRKRVRREKRWHEEIENERKLWKGGMIGAGLLAGAGGVLVGRKLRKPKVPVVKPVVTNVVKFPKKTG